MAHVCLHQMASSQRRAQRQFAGENPGSDNTSKLARVISWISGMSAADAEEVEHSSLGLEDGAAADGADFDGGHGDGDLEVAVETVFRLACVLMYMGWQLTSS